MPNYDPNWYPYVVHTKELPSAQAAANAYKALPYASAGTTNGGQVGTVGNTWSQSPALTPNWGDESQAPGSAAAQATSPVATAGVVRPDAVINARTIANSASVNQEVVRQTAAQTAATNNLTALNAMGPTPTISTVTPNTGVHGAAFQVVIVGSGFTGATAVNIGGACTAVTVQSDTQLTCMTPAASVAGAANVTVTTPKGTGTMTGGMTYT